jgi:hypothetical protein
MVGTAHPTLKLHRRDAWATKDKLVTGWKACTTGKSGGHRPPYES